MLALMLVQCLIVAVEANSAASEAVTADSHHEMLHDAHDADIATDIAVDDHSTNCDHCCQCHGHSHGAHLALLSGFSTSFPDAPPGALCRISFAVVTGHIANIYRPPIL